MWVLRSFWRLSESLLFWYGVVGHSNIAVLHCRMQNLQSLCKFYEQWVLVDPGQNVIIVIYTMNTCRKVIHKWNITLDIQVSPAFGKRINVQLISISNFLHNDRGVKSLYSKLYQIPFNGYNIHTLYTHSKSIMYAVYKFKIPEFV